MKNTHKPTGPSPQHGDPDTDPPRWLEWAQRLQAIAQSGLHYAQDRFDVERYEQVRELAAEIMAAGSGTPLDRIAQLFDAETGYCTPKIDVRAAVFRDGRVLLVRDYGDDLWTLPGGWADVLATPAENVEREVLEEAGLAVRTVRPIAILDRRRHGHEPPEPRHCYKLFFLCEALDGREPTAQNETTDAGWFAPDALPELSVRRVTREQITMCFAAAADAAWDVRFD